MESMERSRLDADMPLDGRGDEARLKVLKVQRTCVHDGPGIRTTVFFQGCGLRCAWCQNPESLPFGPGSPNGDHSVDSLLEVVSRDREYYAQTGGGVTLSGGEPFLQDPEALVPFLKALKGEGIHVSAETSLHAPWKNVEAAAPYIDLFLVDLKVVGDTGLHKRCTGQDGSLIRDNIKRLLAIRPGIRFRMAVVPGFNDTGDNLRATASFLKASGHASIELLKYHAMYEDKARRLSLAVEPLNITPERSSTALQAAAGTFAECGIEASCTELCPSRRMAVFTPRVHAIRKAIRESDRHLCFEVSKLKTEYYRKNGFSKPTPIHRSERLAHVLGNKSVIVYPHELLVGNFTSKRVGGQVWEEHYGVLFASILHQIHRQTPVAFKCSWQDRIDFFKNTLPFWARHSLMMKVNDTFRKLLITVARTSENVAGFNNNMAAIAHFTVNYERMLRLGTTGIIAEIEAARQGMSEGSQAFYEGAIIALKALETFAERYADALSELSGQERDPERRRELEGMAAICRHVPRYPARTFHEALQSMLFLQIALCIESYENAVSHGRLDQVLNPYYESDCRAGLIDYVKAKELLALFILKMDEAILVNDGDTYLRIGRLFETMSTDQAVTAGGLRPDGTDGTNDVTYMLLDICELQPYACNMTARIHRNSPPEYLERLAEVYLGGAPMPALYNDEVYLDTMARHYPDTPVEDLRNYAVIGCVEPNASDDHYGNTDCANVNVVLPFLQALRGEEDDLWNFGFLDGLEKVTTKFFEYNCRRDDKVSRFVLAKYTAARKWFRRKRASRLDPTASMDVLIERFQKRLNDLTAAILSDHQKIEEAIRKDFTTPLASTLFPGCIARGRDVCEGGATINSSGIQAVGITDVADSLFALDEVVFRQKLFTMHEVIEALEGDFTGEQGQRVREALLGVPKFGQDDSREAVQWVNRTLNIYVNALRSVKGCPRNGIYTAGYYALNVNDVYGKKTPALPSGRLAGAPLANSITPHYGMQAGDLTSSLNAVAGVDYASYAPNGTTVTFTIDSALFPGSEGVKKLAAIFKTFFMKGGMQFQPNVINREILLDAYHHPEKYPHLLVRVAGYCSYFNDLSDDLKKIIINRTCYG